MTLPKVAIDALLVERQRINDCLQLLGYTEPTDPYAFRRKTAKWGNLIERLADTSILEMTVDLNGDPQQTNQLRSILRHYKETMMYRWSVRKVAGKLLIKRIGVF
jgi:hypothetical protein